MPAGTKRLNQLTVTRFFAAFSVVLFHGGKGLVDFFPVLASGPTAVGYFYVLSGYVLTLAYYQPGTNFEFKSYWLARFSRIYPVYIFSFVLTCIYYLDILSKIKSDKILANIFLYQAWFPRFAQSFNYAAWSLSVEVFFYVLFPFLIIFAARLPVKKVIGISLAIWIVSQITHSVMLISSPPETKSWLAYFPLFHLNSFLLGIAGGVWYVTNISQLKINQFANRLLLLIAVGGVLFLLSLREFAAAFPTSFSLDNGLLAPFFLIIILTLALDTTRLGNALSHPWLVLLGNASYALYILHIPFRWLFEKFPVAANGITSYNTAYAIYIMIIIFLSILVFMFIERPAKNWLLGNAHKLPAILLDIILIFAAIWLSFAIRLGGGIAGFLRTQNFTLRVGVVIFFLTLLVFQFYKTNSKYSLGLAILFGTITLTGFMYFAWTKDWVEGFPRPVIFLIAIFVFSSMYISHFLVPSIRSQFKPQI